MHHFLTNCCFVVISVINLAGSVFTSLSVSPITPVIYGKQTFVTTNVYTGSITIYWYINNTHVYTVSDNFADPPVVTDHSTTFKAFLEFDASNDPSGDVFMTLTVDLSPPLTSFYLRVEDSDSTTPLTATTIATECDISQKGVMSNVTQVPCGLGCNATFSCADGYQGCSVTATCQNDATWSKSIICEAVRCSLPQRVDCGCATSCEFSGSDLQFGESISRSCPDGCTGTSTAVCEANKLLNVTNSCQPVICNLNEPLQCSSECNGNCTYNENSSASIQYNGLVNLTCPSGCNGIAVARCQQQGMVVVATYCHPEASTCNNSSAVTCSLPQQADCGCGTSCEFSGSDLQLGENINMTCPDGCTGTSTSVCGANNLLNVTKLCEPVVCHLNESLPCASECEGDCVYHDSPATLHYNDFVPLICPSGCEGLATAKCQHEGMVVTTSVCVRRESYPNCTTVCPLNEPIPCPESCVGAMGYATNLTEIVCNDVVALTCPVGYSGTGVAKCGLNGLSVVASYCNDGTIPVYSGHLNWICATLLATLYYFSL